MADRFSKAAQKIEQQQEFTREQELLHQKYSSPELKDVVIKEKSNTFKFTVRTIKELIKTICNIVLILLASVGIISVLYPQTRTELISVLNAIWQDLLNML